MALTQWTSIVNAVIETHAGMRAERGVQKLKGDASSRCYYRVKDGTNNLIAMKLAEDPLKSDEVVDGERPKSVPFLEVHAFLKKGGLPVPEVYFVDLSAGVILLEDLGDLTVEKALAQGMDKKALYCKAIALMADMHAYAERSPDYNCICFRRTFGEGLLRWELEHFYEWGLLALTGKVPSPAERAVLDDFFTDLVKELCSLHQGFVHRDFQSRNLMVQGESLRIIDFQDALLGPYVYDLVSLLRDSYVEFRREEIVEYQKVFIEERAARGLFAPDPVTLMRDFQLQALQRKLKDAGRFVYIDRVKKNPKFLPNIPRSLAYAREAFEYLEKYAKAQEVLAKYLPEHFA